MILILHLVAYAVTGLLTLLVFSILNDLYDWEVKGDDLIGFRFFLPIAWPLFWLAGIVYLVVSRIYRTATFVQQLGSSLATAIKNQKKDQ